MPKGGSLWRASAAKALAKGQVAVSKWQRVPRTDVSGHLSFQKCMDYNKRAKRIGEKTGRGYTCHAMRWDDVDEAGGVHNAEWRQQMQANTPPVGRVLTYLSEGEVRYFDKKYLDTHGYHD